MVTGILNVYKEKDYTSHDVVAKLRKIIGQKKIGHTGTLDPDATGVLPVCLGRATKVCDLLTNKRKTYEATMILGVSTDTQDMSGTILEKKDTSFLTNETLRNTLLSFVGEYQQLPPMYSALKVKGKKLYELAREGKSINRTSRQVMIYELNITDISLPEVTFTVTCSKGTYIRTLCHDVGRQLLCGGALKELRRTKVSDFTLEDSHTLDEISDYVQEERLLDILYPVDYVFLQYKKGILKAVAEPIAYNGGKINACDVLLEETPIADEMIRIYNENQIFVGVYRYEDKEYHLVKLFYINE